MKPPRTVLVLCTGNSCRSQMAEVILNHDLAGLVRALSAGTRPQAAVAAGAIEALRLIGLPTGGLHPKDLDHGNLARGLGRLTDPLQHFDGEAERAVESKGHRGGGDQAAVIDHVRSAAALMLADEASKS